jgi:hypothetical protein
VDRKKPPALTSPWKVGFLVALMLVVTGLGVGYFISGSFGLKWTWIELGGASPATWTFRLDAFIEQMVPLIAVVTLLAVASYVLVSGAVKRYQRFVDSGVEYKQLLRSIKSIDDLEDEERVEQLKQHPELREFLMGFKKRMEARERQLNEREKRPAAPRESESATRKLPAECGVLVSAIMNGQAGFAQDLSLTIPELKQIERAAREQLARNVPAASEVDTLQQRINAIEESVRRHGAGIRRDTDACVAGVREMEKLLGQLKQAIDAQQESAVATQGIATAAKQLDAMAETLTSLGEETRRIAIAAALEASGGGGEGQSIKVADEVRTIATRFNAVAAQWKKAGPALRTGIGTIEKGAASTAQRRKSLAAAAAKAAASAQMWGERLVALQEQVRGLERATGGEPETAPAREWGTIDTSFDDEAAGVGIEPNVRPAADETYEEPEAEHEEVADAGSDDESGVEGFETGKPASVFEEVAGEDEAQFADIPGFEKEQRVFRENLAEAQGDHEPAEGIEVDAGAGSLEEAASEAAETRETETTPERQASDDGFLTGPRGAAAKGKRPAVAPPAPEPDLELAPRRRPPGKPAPAVIETEDEPQAEEDGRFDIDADVDADADALDLYALGAVDFVEGVHA